MRPPGRAAAVTMGAAAGVIAIVLAGCSDDEAATTTTTIPLRTTCEPAEPTLRVDLIDDAIAAVEAERGDATAFYEINATAQLVNLFVAGDAASGEVIPYAFAGGELSSTEPSTGAQGATFTGDRLDFDPQRVTSCVAAELPTATSEAFEVLGGPDGAVQYSIISRSQVGGVLVVTVGPAGSILGVDPVGE